MSRQAGACWRSRSAPAHVRTGAEDDVILHWPCDAERIAHLAWRGSLAEVAASCGVTTRTVCRWRAHLREQERRGA